MKLIRFEKDGIAQYGALEDEWVQVLKGDIFKSLVRTGQKLRLNDVKITVPVIPSKVVAVGLNYKDHAKELGMQMPDEPLIFMKPPSAVIGAFESIFYPPESKRVDYEAEMAIVIKKKTSKIPSQNAGEYILGYTCLNDITARDLQKKDGQWTRAKSFDTFCPIGPVIETDIDPASLKIELLVNKTIRQSSDTSNMIFNCAQLVEFISGIMTLMPGDVIATGTPPGVGPLEIGDEVEVRIEKIGSLVNYVRKSRQSTALV